MKLGKEAKKFALDLTQDTLNSMLSMDEKLVEWSPVLLEAYQKVLDLEDTEAIALFLVMLHQTLDYEQWLNIKEAFEMSSQETFVQNTLTYESSNKMDEILK